MRLAAFALASLALACTKREAVPSEAAEETAVETPAETGAEMTAEPRLEPLWIAEGFADPEGVALAPDGAYFISNVAGEGEAKDGEGWISKLSVGGEVLAERWAEGLDAPKGMAVLDGVLYVADIDQVRTFDAASGAPGAAIAIEGAQFLNDATEWSGEIFLSDSQTARIWRLTADGPVVWREGEELSGVNGLLGAGDKMYVSTMSSGSLYEASGDGGWRQFASGMENADGIGVVPSGGWLVSSWPGEIHFVAPDGAAVVSLLDTREAGTLQNDLTMFGDVVIVPNWKPGTVTAWRFVP